MTQHTAEPWYVADKDTQPHGYELDLEGLWGTFVYSEHVGLSPALAHGESRVAATANANHIVACVNACEGINPEAVSDLLAACKAAYKYLDTGDGNHDRGGRPVDVCGLHQTLKVAIVKAETDNAKKKTT